MGSIVLSPPQFTALVLTFAPVTPRSSPNWRLRCRLYSVFVLYYKISGAFQPRIGLHAWCHLTCHVLIARLTSSLDLSSRVNWMSVDPPTAEVSGFRWQWWLQIHLTGKVLYKSVLTVVTASSSWLAVRLRPVSGAACNSGGCCEQRLHGRRRLNAWGL